MPELKGKHYAYTPEGYAAHAKAKKKAARATAAQRLIVGGPHATKKSPKGSS